MKKTTGYIFTRGKTYYLTYIKNHKKTTVRLLTVNGAPVSNQEEAEASRDRILFVVNEKNKAEQARLLRNNIMDADESVKQKQIENANAESTLDRLWDVYLSCPHRLRSCRKITELKPLDMAYIYRRYCNEFSKYAIKQNCRLISDVTFDVAYEWLESRQESDNTYNKRLSFMKTAWDTMLKDGKITGKNPFSDIERAFGAYHSKSELTREQISTLFDSCDGETKVLFMIGYYTGLRRGDCCTLKWSEVNLKEQIIKRIPSKTVRYVKDLSQSLVKIGIPNRLFDVFRTLDKSGEYILPTYAQLVLEKKTSTVNRRIMAVFKKAGIQTRVEGTGYKRHWDAKAKKFVKDESERSIVKYGFHSLRYSYISHCAELGVPAAIIQKNAGHSNPAMTEHYTKISDEAARRFANLL